MGWELDVDNCVWFGWMVPQCGFHCPGDHEWKFSSICSRNGPSDFCKKTCQCRNCAIFVPNKRENVTTHRCTASPPSNAMQFLVMFIIGFIFISLCAGLCWWFFKIRPEKYRVQANQTKNAGFQPVQQND